MIHHFDPESKQNPRACSGSTLAYPSEEIQVGAISRNDDGFSQGMIMIDLSKVVT
jgi:hypothetical protein